ncbi:hypothetical protein RB195_003684 [Necator americanus]|uniref:SSD domain-containing protein n=1 Tax=Necator americanus TaxID=51031 RepID=A0ABR1DPN0_NECAM
MGIQLPPLECKCNRHVFISQFTDGYLHNEDVWALYKASEALPDNIKEPGMSLSYLLLPLLSSFTSSIGFTSLLLNWKSTIIYQLTELLIALLLSIDYIPIAVFILQLAIVVKVVAREMGYDIVIRLCD